MQVTQYLGYSSLKDFFPTMHIKANPSCSNPLCHKRQAEWAAGAAEREAAAAAANAEEAAAAAATAVAVHEDNDWGIEVVPDDGKAYMLPAATVAAPLMQQQQQALPDGVQFSMPLSDGMDAEALRQEAVQETDAGVDDLMALLDQLATK